jgi:hypothetical protein
MAAGGTAPTAGPARARPRPCVHPLPVLDGTANIPSDSRRSTGIGALAPAAGAPLFQSNPPHFTRLDMDCRIGSLFPEPHFEHRNLFPRHHAPSITNSAARQEINHLISYLSARHPLDLAEVRGRPRLLSARYPCQARMHLVSPYAERVHTIRDLQFTREDEPQRLPMP